MKRTLSWFGLLASVVIIVAFFWTQRTHAPVLPDENTGVDPVVTQPEKTSPIKAPQTSPLIEVTAPLPNAQITSPLTVTGRARGPWYFEASFPIELRDSNNIIIGSTIGQAQSDWMTENYVPFTATLTFPAQPTGSVGVLILKKDNPSGDPQYDDSISVPVQF